MAGPMLTARLAPLASWLDCRLETMVVGTARILALGSHQVVLLYEYPDHLVSLRPPKLEQIVRRV